MFAVSTFATVRVIEVNKSDKPADSTVSVPISRRGRWRLWARRCFDGHVQCAPCKFQRGIPEATRTEHGQCAAKCSEGFRITEAFYFVE